MCNLDRMVPISYAPESQTLTLEPTCPPAFFFILSFDSPIFPIFPMTFVHRTCRPKRDGDPASPFETINAYTLVVESHGSPGH